MPVNTIAMPALVGGGDHFVVAHAAARLDDRRAPLSATTSRPSRNGKNASEATTEPRERQPRVLRLDRGDARRVDAAHLARADAERAAARGEDDRVRLDELGDAPGEQQVVDLRPASGLRCVTTLQLGSRDVRVVGRLHQQAAADALQVERVARARPAAARSRARARSSSRAMTRERFGACTPARSALRRTAPRPLRASRRPPARLNAMMPPNADVGSVAKRAAVRVERRLPRPRRRTGSRA